jgi:hypothetical protein
MHRTDKNNEADVPPDPQVMMDMGPLMEKLMQSGAFLAGEGLRASAHGVRLNYAGGKLQQTPGPFAESAGVISGFAIVQVDSLAAAIQIASRFADALGDVEIDIRPVMEMWDLGMCPKPEGLAITRYGLTYKPANTRGGSVPLPSSAVDALTRLSAELTKSGQLLMAERLLPSSESLRLQYSQGQPTIVDGPFAESKELIAGFSIFKLPSIQETIPLSTDFVKVVGDVEIDIRPLYEAAATAS